MSNVTCVGESPKCLIMEGKAGVILATPITAISVTIKITERFLFSICNNIDR
jgi:hypothetical protein